ncbi:MAG: hypothetical protein JRN67_12555, partial [Nitrososphaerota archaeon]|nr:hypothetical protein [Nitrososphaerota archaeon]
YGWFAFVQPNISKTKEVDRWVRDLQGVRSTSLRLVEDFVNLATEAFRGELDKKIAVGIPQIQSK